MHYSLLRLSPTARYALRGMTYLALLPRDRYALVGEIAQAEKLPRHFLAKILQRLAQRQMLTSRRGPGGGYALASEPSDITLLDILATLDETPAEGHCFVENRLCDSKQPCAMHETVKTVGTQLQEAMQKMTLADLCQDSPSPT